MQDSPHRPSDHRRCPSCGRSHRPGWRQRPEQNSRLLGLVVVLLLLASLAVLATGLPDYWRNFAQNTAADLAGGTLFAFAIGPLTDRQARAFRPEAEPDDPVEPATPVLSVPDIPAQRAQAG